MASLYQAGWRQGSVASVSLRASTATDNEGKVEVQATTHDRWIVATQDCDLNSADISSNVPNIELRPVYAADDGPDFDPIGPEEWGIRSRKFRLNEERDFTHAASMRIMVSPAVLARHDNARVSLVSEERAASFKAWLGRRYDRPAVPMNLVNLAQAVAKASKKHTHSVRDHVHDLLMTFDETKDPYEVNLYAVVCDLNHSEQCCDDNCEGDHLGDARVWLAEIAQLLDPELGVVGRAESAPRSGTSMLIVEQAYSADLSDITYKKDGPAGAG